MKRVLKKVQTKQYLALIELSVLSFTTELLQDSLGTIASVFFTACFAPIAIKGIRQKLRFLVLGAHPYISNFAKKVKQTHSISENGVELMHIINYEEGDGSVILSADKKAFPVLAYGKKKSFNYSNPDELPEGLKLWMHDQKEQIKALKRQTKETNKNIAKGWKELEEGTLFVDLAIKRNNQRMEPIDPTPDCGASFQTRERSSFISTEWGQSCGWNARCPEKNNGDLCSDGKRYAKAGCIPVAMAQVIHYYKPYISSYNFNYSSMEDLSATNETARLIYVAGATVGANYGGDATWAYPWQVNDALRRLGLQCGDRVDYAFSRVKHNLFNGQPVILEGRKDAVSNWHVWVADGAREVYNPCYTYAYLHLNWGWEGRWNGWYGSSDWTPDDHDFTSYKKAIIDIRL